MNEVNREVKNKGWSVTLAGFGINLALGILYTWSIFKESILESIKMNDGRFAWNLSNLNDPYAVCCLSFAFTMIIAGRVQDKIGPRLTAVIGGIFAAVGLVWSSLSFSLTIWVLGFGLFTGMGIGFSYASATPPAIKWFPPSKTGVIAGIVVAGFGLASVYIAPLSKFLIARFGLSTTMMIFGTFFLIVVCGLAQLLVNPPIGYRSEDKLLIDQGDKIKVQDHKDYNPSEILTTSAFYKLWIMFAISAGTGLMIISNVAGMAKQSLGVMAWIGVVLMAIGNASGRIIAGIVSDRIGCTRTMLFMMSSQAIIMFALLAFGSTNAIFVISVAIMVGFNYGTNLALFPSAVKDYFGLKNFGVNYGLMFTAWGIGGFLLPKISQIVQANTDSFKIAYLIAGSLLVLSAGISLITRAPKN